MALPTSIKTLFGGGIVEWARIEFKATWDSQASLKTICAFANDIDNWGGGYLVIGVSSGKDGMPGDFVGVPNEKIDAYLKDIPLDKEAESLGALAKAQASGDLLVLSERGRRCLHLHLPDNSSVTLRQLAWMIGEILDGKR